MDLIERQAEIGEMKKREKMTREELDKVLENHQHWLRNDVEGWQDMRANLWGANLRGANLRGANLRQEAVNY